MDADAQLSSAFNQIRIQFESKSDEIEELNRNVAELKTTLLSERSDFEQQIDALRRQNSQLVARLDEAARRASQLELEVARYSRVENERILAGTTSGSSAHRESIGSIGPTLPTHERHGSLHDGRSTMATTATIRGLVQAASGVYDSQSSHSHHEPAGGDRGRVSHQLHESQSRIDRDREPSDHHHQARQSTQDPDGDARRRAAADSLMSEEGSEQLLQELDRSIASLREHGDQLLHRYAQESDVTANQGTPQRTQYADASAAADPRPGNSPFGSRIQDSRSRSRSGNSPAAAAEPDATGSGTSNRNRNRSQNQIPGRSKRSDRTHGKGGLGHRQGQGHGQGRREVGGGAGAADRFVSPGGGGSSTTNTPGSGSRQDRNRNRNHKQGGGFEKGVGMRGEVAGLVEGEDGGEGGGGGGLEDATHFFETLQKSVGSEQLAELMAVLARFNGGEVTQREVMNEATRVIGKRSGVLEAFEDFLLGE